MATRSAQAAAPDRPAVDADLSDAAVRLYRELHAHPELSGAEQQTAERFAAALRSAGHDVTTGVGGHGVVGVLANGPGPTVLLRAELDALPVAEQTGLPYASTATGRTPDGRDVPVMHACGHDLHLAAAAGAAATLTRRRDSWQGTLLVIGQPAEETLHGAAAMLADGLHERFGRPDAVLAQHAAVLPAGMVAHGAGPITAGGVTLEITITGRGGHVATPHLCVDPVVIAATAVVQLQAIVSRQTGPADPVSLSVGTIHGGSHAGVIADQVTLGVTLRALSEPTLRHLLDSTVRTVRACCDAGGCPEPPLIREASRSPVNRNDPTLAARVRAAHEAALGAERVAWWPPSLATEDFPLLGDGCIPTVYWMLGTVGPSRWRATPGGSAAEKMAALPTNHSAAFAPYDRLAVPGGIHALTTAALAVLAPVPPAR
ncbi:peptidase [Catellatospora sp. TT07R-123]|uniref:amidohydrolase n=1 Tax=Catellatospora sp. TT07R-123 TaxID=2733863 RepID=UPI001B26524E|nr:amidohydrolase [Catellatospora sp. TT07R-123]GHJ47288.1 peptidase [Catellatospora sp. TT07R-123]